jgi:hypothetical protein
MFDELYEIINNLLEDTSEKEDYFNNRTNRHIGMVQRAAEKIVEAYPEFEKLLTNVQHHDSSKFKEPEYTPYVELAWATYHEGGEYKKPGTIDNKEQNQAGMHHILNNEHHPEYWAKNVDSINNSTVVDATRMPDIAIAEMVADWQAMSEELKKNTAREWFEKQKDVRWHFSPEQEELIDKLLKVFENVLENGSTSNTSNK